MIVAVVGPTASGKSDLAIEIAASASQHGYQGGEVISADAMQLYRGMDIGTAKTPLSQRRGVPHHLLDVLDVSQEASVAAYQKAAREAVLQVQQRDNLPVVAGGSGLYLRALLTDLDMPGTDLHLRQELEEQLAQTSPQHMHARLCELDRAAAEKIDYRNTRRVIRALEVITLTGKPFAASLPRATPWQPAVQIGLRWNWQALDERINRRTRQMFDQGFVAEVSRLQASLRGSKTAALATGYVSVLSYLAGEITLEQAISDTQLATRQLARKQMKWLRKDTSICWIDLETDADYEKLRAEVWGYIRP